MNKRETLSLCLPSRPEISRDYIGVYEAKLFDQFDRRGASYEQARLRCVSVEELQNPCFQINTRYWISKDALVPKLPGYWIAHWLLVWQDITDVNTMARTVSSAILPLSGTDFTIRACLGPIRKTEQLAWCAF